MYCNTPKSAALSSEGRVSRPRGDRCATPSIDLAEQQLFDQSGSRVTESERVQVRLDEALPDRSPTLCRQFSRRPAPSRTTSGSGAGSEGCFGWRTAPGTASGAIAGRSDGSCTRRPPVRHRPRPRRPRLTVRPNYCRAAHQPRPPDMHPTLASRQQRGMSQRIRGAAEAFGEKVIDVRGRVCPASHRGADHVGGHDPARRRVARRRTSANAARI